MQRRSALFVCRLNIRASIEKRLNHRRLVIPRRQMQRRYTYMICCRDIRASVEEHFNYCRIYITPCRVMQRRCAVAILRRDICAVVEEHLNHFRFCILSGLMQGSPTAKPVRSKSHPLVQEQLNRRDRSTGPQRPKEQQLCSIAWDHSASFQARPPEHLELDGAVDGGLAGDGDVQDAAFVQRGLSENLVQLPAVAVGEPAVPDGRYVGVGERLGAVRAQVLAQALGFDEGDWLRPPALGYFEERVVSHSVSGGVLGNDHRGVGGVPSQSVEKRVD